MEAFGFLYGFPGWTPVTVEVNEDDYQQWRPKRNPLLNNERTSWANLDGDQIDEKRPSSRGPRKRRRPRKDSNSGENC